ncbi:MAG: DUF2889 domain-containing protein [Acidimicrobiales bacterium]
MSQADPAPTRRVPIHRRTIDIEAFDAPEHLELVCYFLDERPWAASEHHVVHQMELEVDVRKADLVITRAEARMVRFPHTECPDITPKFGELVGVSIARGYNRAVQERFIGIAGCTHLEFMARALGPAVVQAAQSAKGYERITSGAAPRDIVVTPFMRNTCHVWRDGGPAMDKIDAGWRPGLGGFPVPTVVEIRRLVQEQQSQHESQP